MDDPLLLVSQEAARHLQGNQSQRAQTRIEAIAKVEELRQAWIKGRASNYGTLSHAQMQTLYADACNVYPDPPREDPTISLASRVVVKVDRFNTWPSDFIWSTASHSGMWHPLRFDVDGIGVSFHAVEALHNLMNTVHPRR